MSWMIETATERKILSILLVTFMAALNSGCDTDTGLDGTGEDTDSQDSPSPTDSNTEASMAVCAQEDRVGTFQLFLAEDYTSFTGSVSDYTPPASISEVLMVDGECTLLGPPDLYCPAGCTALGETCGPDGECQAAAVKQSAGVITVTGLNLDLKVSPNGITGDYSSLFSDPYPGFDDQAAISLSAAGADFNAFQMQAVGVSAVQSSMETLLIERDTPASLTWDAPTSSNPAQYMHVELIVNAHGATSGWIVCDVPDTGSFEIPASLNTALIDLGLSGFPRLTLSRRSSDISSTGAGCAELIVFSQLIVPVDVPGLSSCNSNDDCVDGESCQDDLVCRP